MIGVRLMGGLGNQMFQYATALRLAHMLHTEVVMDLQFYENQHPDDTIREYELGQFTSIDNNFLAAQNRPTETPYIGRKGRLKKIAHALKGKSWLFYREQTHDFDHNVAFLPNQTYLVGFWQTEKYFADIRPLILDKFSFGGSLSKNQMKLLKDIESGESVSLHVRRGDYVTNPNANKVHGTKGNDYYSNAVKTIAKKVKAPVFYVISDDLEWCKKNLKTGQKTIYVDVNSRGYEDLWFMSRCKHNIIANSSFSWWGAWLNQNPDKIVVAPKKWFNDGEDGKDRVPDEWIRL